VHVWVRLHSGMFWLETSAFHNGPGPHFPVKNVGALTATTVCPHPDLVRH